MKRLQLFLLAVTLLAGLSACNANKENEETLATTSVGPKSVEGKIIPGQYIISIKQSVIPSAVSRLDWTKIQSREDKIAQMGPLNQKVGEEIDSWLSKYGVSTDAVIAKYTAAMSGVALKLSAEQFDRISKDDAIESLEFDRVEELLPFKVESVDNSGNRTAAQTTPCGITNAGGSTTSTNAGWIWIVDTGIDLDHPDLNVQTNTTYAKSFVGGTADDCNGHGTHVAGIAAARNNTIGVVGVSQSALVVPVRVFGCSGPSATSTIISGINHVATYDIAGDVMNMSLGGYFGSTCSTSSSYKTSVTTVANGGTHVAIASGNNMSNAANYQPGCLNGTRIYTVTNMRCDKTYYNDPTYGGNYGRPPVDWIATGTSVYSTYMNGGYATLTGTSMSTPHVAGILHVRNGAPISGGNVTYSGVSYPIAKR